MKQKLPVVFGTYNSQSIGATEEEMESLYQRAYKPFLTIAYNFPQAPLTLYYSGILLEWIERRHPEFHAVLGEMVNRKQVELLGGGFYEPLLPLIPSADRIGQIEAMTTSLRKGFGKRARGFWLPQSVWDPSLVSALKSAGMSYFFVDGRVVPEGALHRLSLIEDQGKTTIAFPFDSKACLEVLRRTPGEFVAYLRKRAREKGAQVLALLVRGESFTFSEGEGSWLELFLREMEGGGEELNLTHAGTCIKQKYTQAVRAYLRGISLSEMETLDFPPARVDHADKESFKAFLNHHRESLLLYSKMVYVSVLTGQIRGDKYRKKAAREELWKGQNHIPYWQSYGGGICHLEQRGAAYRALIEAEKITREKGGFKPSLTSFDFDMDGVNEYLYHGHTYNAYLCAEEGAVFELDYLPDSWNCVNAFMQRTSQEKPCDISRKLFRDRILLPEISFDSFRDGNYRERKEFSSAVYVVEGFNHENRYLSFSKKVKVGSLKSDEYIEVRKKYLFKRSSIEVGYSIKNFTSRPFVGCIGCELNLSPSLPKKQEIVPLGREGEPIDVLREKAEVGSVLIKGALHQVFLRIDWTTPAYLWIFPVVTRSSLEGKEKDLYQCHCFLPHWALDLAPGEIWKNDLSLRFERA